LEEVLESFFTLANSASSSAIRAFSRATASAIIRSTSFFVNNRAMPLS
jgi:hypothetical protein